MNLKTIFLFIIIVIPRILMAEPYSYKNIAQRYPSVKLDEKMVKDAKMEGECLVGLKELNFKKRNKFDAVAEWTNYRTISLLQHLSPCSVLIMMEVARTRLRISNNTQSTGPKITSK